jgi:hypothetical protein
LQNVIQILSKAGVDVKRYAINQAAIAFVSNAVVRQFIRTEGTDKLPLTLFDGKIIKQANYPSLEELWELIPGLKNIIQDGKR